MVQAVNTPLEGSDGFTARLFPQLADLPARGKQGLTAVMRQPRNHRPAQDCVNRLFRFPLFRTLHIPSLDSLIITDRYKSIPVGQKTNLSNVAFMGYEISSASLCREVP